MNSLAVTLGLLISSLFCQLGPNQIGSAVSSPARYGVAPSPNPDCPRGAAEPVVKKAVFPKTTFHLQPDKLTGIETVTCPNGDQVTIYNEGCEYYMLRFRFVTSRFAPPTADQGPWFRHAASLMSGLLPGLHAPINLEQGVRTLTARLNQDQKKYSRPLTLGETLDYGAKTMRSSLSIDSLAPMAGNKTVVEVTFAIGPL